MAEAISKTRKIIHNRMFYQKNDKYQNVPSIAISCIQQGAFSQKTLKHKGYDGHLQLTSSPTYSSFHPQSCLVPARHLCYQRPDLGQALSCLAISLTLWPMVDVAECLLVHIVRTLWLWLTLRVWTADSEDVRRGLIVEDL